MLFENWLMLLIACLVMSFSPGPNAIFALTTTIRIGAKAGMRIVLGSILGFSCLILFAMFGLATVFKHQPHLIFMIKIIGATYLIYLAFSLFNQKKSLRLVSDDVINVKKLFRTGFYLAVSNPKIILFWIAFVPSIVDASSLHISTFLMVVMTFIIVEGVAEMSMVILGKAIQPFFAEHLAKIEKISACIFLVFSGLMIKTLYG